MGTKEPRTLSKSLSSLPTAGILLAIALSSPTIGTVAATAADGAVPAWGTTAREGPRTGPQQRQQQQRAAISPQQATLAPAITLDFETGDLRGWTASGNAFNNQPTWGDNSRVRGAQPANHQGEFWVGTFENRPRTVREAGGAQGDRPQGTLTSTPFNVPEGTLSFLVGGGAAFETRVELRIFDQIEGDIRAAFASGENVETMRRVTWDLTQWAGRRAQIVIVDESSGPWGHINVDDFRFGARGVVRPDISIDRVPELQNPQVSPTRVPNLIGENADGARRLLDASRLQLGQIAQEPSLRPAGTVLRQEPQAGTVVQPGSVVNISLAAPIQQEEVPPPPQPVVVPDVLGREAGAALEILKAAGFEGRVVDRREARQTPGTVVAQEPQGGRRADPGIVVELVMAIPVTTVVPQLEGSSEADARRRLDASELRPGRVAGEESRNPAGTVLRQSEPAGTRVEVGTAIDMVVATPVTVTVPDVLGLEVAEARRQIEAAELVVGTLSETESRRPSGIVLTQSERGGSTVEVGTAVDLMVSIPVTVVVPDLTGRNLAEARGLLEGLELGVGAVTTRESREAEGSVLTQQPAGGAQTTIGTTVDLVIAEPVTVLVPDLVGFLETDARGLLGNAELLAGGVARRESRQPVGTVLEQTIAAGQRVIIGTTVGMVLAEPVTVIVPEVVGRSEADATAAVEAAELVVGNVQYQESPAAVGTVLTQSLNPGTRVQIGSAVNLLVAVVETVPVPELVGQPIEQARRALVTGRLEVGTEELRETRVEAEGTVLEQSRAAGSVAAVGTPVSLVVATPEIIEVPSLIGLSESEAIAVLTGAGLVLGAVGEQLSIEAGGTVLAQAQPAGSPVVFGTPIGLQVARSRTVWAVPSALLLLLLGGAATVMVARRRTARPRRVEEKKKDEAPPLPEIHVEPVTDAGTQSMEAGPEPTREGEVRLHPRVDAGVQTIESPGELIAGERSPDEH